ncbi:MAG: hypothetical protein KDB23_13010, partial [Planctomycetales bacterium]|nr:hypothetical protein [Planctomycetales bacterium]
MVRSFAKDYSLDVRSSGCGWGRVISGCSVHVQLPGIGLLQDPVRLGYLQWIASDDDQRVAVL